MKFVKIYGESELEKINLTKQIQDEIKKLDSDTKIIYIANNTSEEIFVDIPDLSRFENLESIKIENCAKSIAGSYLNLKNLKFLTLTNNKDLERIPDGIETLENLLFVSVEKSEKVKLSEEFKSAFIELDSPGFYILRENYEE